MPLLQDLPVELLHNICTFCPKSDIRSLRLTSRLLEDIADEHFLDAVVVFFAREDFETAENIVNNPRIAKNVKSVVFHTDRVPWLGPNFGIWNEFRKRSLRVAMEGGIDAAERRYIPSESDRERRSRLRQPNRELLLEESKHSRKELRAAYEHYNRLSEDQNTMMVELRAAKCLEHIFRLCTKVETVTVAMNDHHPAWRSVNALRKGMLHPCGDNVTNRLGVRSLNEVLTAKQATGKHLSTLEAYPISFQFFAQSEERMEEIYAAISGLTAIELQINPKVLSDREVDIQINDDDDEETLAFRVEEFEREADEESYWGATSRVVGSFRDGRLSRFLSKAPRLEHIAVDGIPTRYATDMMHLEHIVGTSPWSAIRVLALRSFRCFEKDLADLVLKYRDTLEELRLGHVLLTKGSVKSLFQTFAGNCPRLSSVVLSGKFWSLDIETDFSYDFRYCSIFKTSVETYLMHGGTIPRQPSNEQFSWATD